MVPDGTMLAFTRYERAAKYYDHLYVVNTDGSNLRLIGSVNEQRPDWQPVTPKRVEPPTLGGHP